MFTIYCFMFVIVVIYLSVGFLLPGHKILSELRLGFPKLNVLQFLVLL